MTNLVCPVCGKKFRANNDFQRTCSKSCAAILREHDKRKKEEKSDDYECVPKSEKSIITGLQNFESRNKELITDVNEANKLGMSYGQYSAIEAKSKIIFKKDKEPDVAEAIKCKDCTFWTNKSGFCIKTHLKTTGLDFCSMGKRKEN